MIRIFFMFLVLMVKPNWADTRKVVKSLECFSTKTPIYKEFPKYILEGSNTETILFSEKEELRTGPPICVMFYGYNSTHSVTWQGHVSSFSMPLECHINSEDYTHCFKSPNNFTFLELSTGWACCCSYDKCNWNNPTFFQFFEQNILDKSEFLNRLKTLAKYSFCIVFCIFFVILETILEFLCGQLFGKGKKKSYEMLEALEDKEKVLVESPADPLLTPLHPNSSLNVQSTQPDPSSAGKSSISYKPLSEMTIRQDSSLKVDKTQEDEQPEDPRRSELEPASTQRGEDDIVPIPPKPEWKVTKTGRVKRTSMNYEESTYSDLQ